MVMLSNSPREQTLLRLEQAKSLTFGLHVTSYNNVPIDLTGATLTFHMAEQSNVPNTPGTILFSKVAEMEDAERGFARFELQAAELDHKAGEYDFDITYLNASGYSVLLVKGVVQLQLNTDRTASGYSYADSAIPQDLTVLLRGTGAISVVTGPSVPPEWTDARTAYVNEAGHLILITGSGALHDAGTVVGPRGPSGPRGQKGEIGDVTPEARQTLVDTVQARDVAQTAAQTATTASNQAEDSAQAAAQSATAASTAAANAADAADARINASLEPGGVLRIPLDAGDAQTLAAANNALSIAEKARDDLTDLSLSIPSFKSVASEAAATLYLAELSDAGITPSVANPVWVWRSDLTRLLINDGSKWRVVAGTIAGRRRSTTAQNIASATWTRHTVAADVGSETWNVGGTVSSGVGIAVPVAGLYEVKAALKFSANSSGRRIVGIYVGGTKQNIEVASNPTNGQHVTQVCDVLKLNAGDEVLVGGRQDSGSSITMDEHILSVTYIGPA